MCELLTISGSVYDFLKALDESRFVDRISKPRLRDRARTQVGTRQANTSTGRCSSGASVIVSGAFYER